MITSIDGNTRYINSTVRVFMTDLRIMSDVWEWVQAAEVIDEDGYLRTIYLSEGDKAVVDADEAALQRRYSQSYTFHYNKAMEKANEAANDPTVKGRMVKVVGGRTGDDKGKIGKVVVAIERFYGKGYHGSMKLKLGIALTDRMVEVTMPNGKKFKNHADMIWVWAHNCVNVNPEQPNVAEVEQYAETYAKYEVENLRRTMAKSA